MKRIFRVTALALILAAVALPVRGQGEPTPKFSAKVPQSIQTPDTVQTRIGTLKFFDGLPDEETVKKVYDNLDFARGVEAFMAGMPAASVYALCEGFDEAGFGPNQGIGITEDLMDARLLFLTANSTTVYVIQCIDLKDGPVVMQVPPNVLGPVDDAYFRYVTDVGLVGRDQGKGGKYLFVPPDYAGTLPTEGYFVTKSPTNLNLSFYRAFVQEGDIAAAVNNVKANARVYPLSAAANPPAPVSVNISGMQFNTIHANDFHFYEELNAVVQHEPADAFDPEIVGLFAAISIKKGQPFVPDARMKKILTEAAAVGNATARALTFRSRDKTAYYYPNSAWFTVLPSGYEFLSQAGVRDLDARVMMHYYATGITPAMVVKMVGVGSQYAIATTDSEGKAFDGSKTYKAHLPPGIPAKNFGSFVLYDNQTRSMLQTDAQFPSVGSQSQGIVINADQSVDVWFGPTAPKGHENNWVQTIPGKGFSAILQLYGPE